ncbi:MAG: STN domain-containing protein [Phycisphaerae bacterium]
MNTLRAGIVAVLVATTTGGALAKPATAKLQKALDTPVNFVVEEAAPIGEVFSRLEKETGARIALHDDALEFLPYGEQTRLKVTLKNIKLSKALDRVLSQQALQWKRDGDTIRILPTDALYRLGRRASFDELRLLGVIHSTRIPAEKSADEVRKTFAALSGLDEVVLKFRVYPYGLKKELSEVQADAMKRAAMALPGTGADWLNMLCHGMDWTWYVQGEQVVILDKSAQVRRQLQRQVSVAYRKAALQDVLFDLAGKARVELKMSPGVMRQVPEQARSNLNLIMEEATVSQALQAISGATGLKFTPAGEGLKVEASKAIKDDDQPRRDRPPFFLRMSMPLKDGTNVDVFMRPDDMPEEVVEYVLKRKGDMVRLLQEEAKATHTSGVNDKD